MIHRRDRPVDGKPPIWIELLEGGSSSRYLPGNGRYRGAIQWQRPGATSFEVDQTNDDAMIIENAQTRLLQVIRLSAHVEAPKVTSRIDADAAGAIDG